MNIDSILESAHITHDDKARRVLNTAPDTFADITLSEIENGITIERLTALNVPVYQYSTQITIHGLFKDIPDNLRVAGYKSVIQNNNKSLGVRYVAIDGAKKQLLRDVSRYGQNGNNYNTWVVNIDSQGCQAYRIFTDKQSTLDCYNNTPDSLYIGSKQIAALMFGGYAVIIHIGAIYNVNLWALIGALTGINNESEYQQLVAAREAEYKADEARRELEYQARRDAERAKLESARATFTAPDNWQAFNGKPSAGNTYARIKLDYSGNPYLRVTQYVKRGGMVCAAYKDFTDMIYTAWQPTKYAKAADITINGWIINDKPSAPLESAHAAADGITIRHNDKLNGIEIQFKSKPPESTLDTLKSLGFRWSKYQGIWYNHYSESLLERVKSIFAAAAAV